MSDEIREAFEYELKKGWPQKTPSMWPMFESGWNAGYTSRDAEISELVGVINEMQLAISDPQVSYEEMVALSIKAKRFVSSYTKTPCPECGGIGYEDVASADGSALNGDTYRLKCNPCQGRGYKWEKKG